MTHTTTLTDAQRRAIDATDISSAVVAGAGSGKTTVLIERCMRIIGGTPAELDRLLAITFTEKAAAELKSRLRAKLPRHDHYRLATSWIGTFHAACARMLRQHAPLVALDPSFGILDEHAARLIKKRAVRTTLLAALETRDPHVLTLVDAFDFRNASALMEDLMDFRWHAERALAAPFSNPSPLAGEGGERGAPPSPFPLPSREGNIDEEERTILLATRHAFDLCVGAYHELLAEEDALDFQELEMRALTLLTQEPSVRTLYQRKFKHLLVDEFQDTNDLQTELVLALSAPGTNTLCIVGDPRQSIYRFRGANVDCFARVLARIRAAQGAVIPLMDNFRSQEGIIDFVNRASDMLSSGLFGAHADDAVLTASAERLIAARTDPAPGPHVVTLACPIDNDATAALRRRVEASAIAEYCAALVREERYRPGDIACLFQAMTDVSEYEAAFKRHALPARFFGGRGLLDRQEICDLMHALSYAANPHDDVALVGLARSPLIGLSDEECVRCAGPDGTMLRENLRAHPSCTLLGQLERRAAHERSSELMRMVLDHTGYEAVLETLDPSGGMRANVDRLIAMAAALERQTPTTLNAFCTFVADLRAHHARLADPPATGDGTNALNCMTVHSAKGLEFPVVVLPDLIRKEHRDAAPWLFHRGEGIALKLADPQSPFGLRLPTARYEHIATIEAAEAEAESARLLYVAMTRARDLLVLPLHSGDKVKGRWHEWIKPLIGEGVEIMALDRATSNERQATNDERREPSDDFLITTFNREAVHTAARARARTFTVSQLESFDRCPHEYYLKYVSMLPARTLLEKHNAGLAAPVRGSLVHGVLERLTPRTADTIDTLINEVCEEQGVAPSDAIRAEIMKPLEAFMATELFAHAGEGARETRFDWKRDPHIVTGAIDWYRPQGRGLEIIDFKTDRVDADRMELRAQEYELQMMAYALALEAALAAAVDYTTLVFLTPEKTHRAPVDDVRRARAHTRIDEIIATIVSDDYRILSGSPPCYKCPYHHNGMCAEDRLKNKG